MLGISHKKNLELVLSSLDKNLLDKYKILKNLANASEPNKIENISEYFQPALLAVLFMDIGHHSSGKGDTIHFYTRNFSENAISLLREGLLNIHDISSGLVSRKASLEKGYSPEISISSFHAMKFIDLVKPFILEPFLYKLEKTTRNARPKDFENSVEVTQKIRDVIFGTLLGDASLSGGRNNTST